MLGCGQHMDPLMVFALARERTQRILLTTNIMPTFTRHPLVMAMQARTAQAALGGRLRLGLGPGHASIIDGCFAALRAADPVHDRILRRSCARASRRGMRSRR
jgi:alkanesulfonate monooxygenase SsuD/methylene tetrahydromethanopterin reductase-like flavin-dependent oxidoreductase (luciferase family)